MRRSSVRLGLTLCSLFSLLSPVIRPSEQPKPPDFSRIIRFFRRLPLGPEESRGLSHLPLGASEAGELSEKSEQGPERGRPSGVADGPPPPRTPPGPPRSSGSARAAAREVRLIHGPGEPPQPSGTSATAEAPS